MGTTIYDFASQMKQGQKGEQEIISHLTAKGWHCRSSTRDEQRQGIDLIACKSDFCRSIEIKSDRRASNTGNAFIETVSVFKDDKIIKKGWVYTCQAQYLFYYLPQDLLIYCFKPINLVKYCDRWAKQYRTVSIPNRGYKTKGILVPLHELESTASQIINI